MILAAVTAVITASLLFRAAQEAKLASRSLLQAVALNLAEGAVEEGLFALATTGYTTANGWAVASDSAVSRVKSIAGLNLVQGTGAMHVRIDNPTGVNPVVIGLGVVEIPQQPKIVKQVRVGTGRRKPWGNGMVAKSDITFSVASSVDSYDSSIGPYHAATNRSDKATIATISTAVDAVELNGASSIYGYVATGGADPLVPLGRIYGATSPCPQPPPPPYIDPARVRRDFATNLPNIAPPTTDTAIVNVYNLGAYSVGALASRTLPRAGDQPIDTTLPASATNPYRYSATSVSVSILGTLNISGPVELVVSGNLGVTLLGFINVQNTTNSTLNAYVGGNISLSGFSNAWASTAASAKATLWGTNTTSQNITLSWGSAFVGTIYAPNAALSLNVAADIYGAVVAKTITMSGWGQFHWDSQLANVEVGGFGYRVTAWAELTAPPGSGSAFARDNRQPFTSLF
ncbi:MAG: hypothetical protein FJ399_03565 [Verrucomicrobia bacterium]|nr:hypothetical protein [Verrucomicrobiota bacterium]